MSDTCSEDGFAHRRAWRGWARRGIRRAGFISALTGLLLGSVLAGVAQAATATETAIAWDSAVATVGNGATVTGRAYVNLNDTLGAGGSQDNTIVTLTAGNGAFYSLPQVCLTTDVSPVSAISANRKTVTCNLGMVDFGTSQMIGFSVVAAGKQGDQITVTSTSGTSSATTPAKTITATSGIDVVFDYGWSTNLGGLQYPAPIRAPFGIKVPTGAGWPSGPISFQVQLTNGTVTNATAALAVTGCGAPSYPGIAGPSTIPAATGLAPASCTVVSNGGGLFTVTVDGYTTPPAVAPTTAQSGAALPAGYTFFVVAALEISSVANLSTNAGAYTIVASNLRVGGVATVETSTTNNTETFTLVTSGGWSSGMASQNAPAQWSGQGRNTPGASVLGTIDNVFFYNWTPAQIVSSPSAGIQQFCGAYYGPVDFTGRVILAPGAVASGVKVTFYVTTDPTLAAPSSGSLSAFASSCASASWTQVTAPVDQGGGNSYQLPGDAASWTAIKIRYDYTNSTWSTIPREMNAKFYGTVSASAPAGAEIDFLATLTGSSGSNGFASWGAVNTTIAGAQYGGVHHAGVDYAQVVSWFPQVTKSVIPASVTGGLDETVEYTLKATAILSSGGSPAVTIPVVDTLPAGVTYIPGSSSPSEPTVTAGAGGTTVLTWSLPTTMNKQQTIAFRGKVTATSGTVTNSVSVTAPGVPTPATAAAAVQVKSKAQTELSKSARSSVVGLSDSSDTWVLKVTNRDAAAVGTTDVIDVLPWNGDSRGTNFHGSASITSVSTNPGETVYYTTVAPAALSGDPGDASNGGMGTPSAIWSTTFPADQSATPVTGIRVIGGSLGAGATKSNTIAWTLSGQNEGDAHVNTAFARTDTTQLVMIKSARVDVVMSLAETPHITVTKVLAGTRLADGDQFTVQVRAGAANGALVSDDVHATTGGAGQAVIAGTGTTGATATSPGSLYYVTEAPAGTTSLNLYDAMVDCTDANGMQPGLPGKGTALGTGLAITPVVGSDITCVITNTPRSASVFVEKRGISPEGYSLALDGATWAVLADNAGAPGDAAVGVTISEVVGTGADATAGMVRVDGLFPGIFWLVETKAPQGYNLLATPVQFTVNSDLTVGVDMTGQEGVVQTSVDADQVTHVVIYDVPPLRLPDAGGAGIGPAVATGAMLLLTVAVLMLWPRAPRRREATA